jgi:hypothetical protein
MKKVNKVKKQRDQVSQEELLKAIAALEEMVKAEMPKEWEEEEEVPGEKLPRRIVHLEEKAKDRIRRKLQENDGELTRSGLYNAVRGDRMGLATFNNALKSLEDDGKLAITKERTSGRPVKKIRLLRGMES